MLKTFNPMRSIIFIILVAIFSVSPSASYAQETLNLKQEKINPGDSLYLAKRAFEKIQEKLIFSQSKKISYQEKLLERRVSELKFLVENDYVTPIERATNRFSYQAGTLAGQLKRGDGEEEKKRVLEKFAKLKVIIEKLRDNFPANSAYWLFVQQSADTLSILSEELR